MLKTIPPFGERLIYYLFAPELFSRVVLEFGLGIYWYSITQPKLWMFYICIFIEYALFTARIGKIRFVRSPSVYAFFFFCLLFLHGAVVGFAQGNAPAKIFTDSVPVFVLAGNTLLLSSSKAFEGFDFDRVFKRARIYAVVMVVVGIAAVKLGRPSTVSIGGSGGAPLCLTILLLGMANRPKLSFADFVMLLLVVVPITPNINRTSLVVFFFALVCYLGPKVLANSRVLYVTWVVALGIVVITPLAIPPDSPLMHRLNGLTQENVEPGSGSIGERNAEFAAITDKLHAMGPDSEWLGSGAGGIYAVRLTDGQIKPNYSHAHYGWALFKLRYGYVGYAYLVLFGALLLLNAIQYLRRPDPLGRMVAMLGIWGIVFLFTYFTFNFLIAGLQFCTPPRRTDRAPVEAARPAARPRAAA